MVHGMGGKCQLSSTFFVITDHCWLTQIPDFSPYTRVEPHQLVLAERVSKTHQAVDFFLKIAVSSLSTRTNPFCQETPNSSHTTGKFAEQTHLRFQKDKAEAKKGTNLLTLARYFWKVGKVN